MAVYLIAGIVGLLSGAVALLFPLWRRGGLQEIRRQSRWLVPLFGGLAIFVVAIIAANYLGFGDLVNVGLGVGSVVVVVWLARDARSRLSPRLRRVLWLAAAMSVVLVVLAITNIIAR